MLFDGEYVVVFGVQVVQGLGQFEQVFVVVVVGIDCIGDLVCDFQFVGWVGEGFIVFGGDVDQVFCCLVVFEVYGGGQVQIVVFFVVVQMGKDFRCDQVSYVGIVGVFFRYQGYDLVWCFGGVVVIV